MFALDGDHCYQPHRLTSPGPGVQVWLISARARDSPPLPSKALWYSAYCLPSCILTPSCLLVWLLGLQVLVRDSHLGNAYRVLGGYYTSFHLLLMEAGEPGSVLSLSLPSPSQCILAPLSASCPEPGGWESFFIPPSRSACPDILAISQSHLQHIPQILLLLSIFSATVTSHQKHGTAASKLAFPNSQGPLPSHPLMGPNAFLKIKSNLFTPPPSPLVLLPGLLVPCLPHPWASPSHVPSHSWCSCQSTSTSRAPGSVHLCPCYLRFSSPGSSVGHLHLPRGSQLSSHLFKEASPDL